LLEEVQSDFEAVNSVSKRNAVVDRIENELVTLIELKIQTGTVTEVNQKKVSDFIDDVKTKIWFKDETILSRLETFQSRVNASVGLIHRVNKLKDVYESVEGNSISINAVIEEISAVSKAIQENLYVGSDSGVDAEMFNKFIDEIISDLAKDSPSDSAYLIGTAQTDENLLALKVNVDEDSNFGLRIRKLTSDIDSLSSLTKEDFQSDFDKLVEDWKLAALMDPEVEKDTDIFRPFFEKALSHYEVTSVRNIGLRQSVELERDEILEDKFDANDKVAMMTEYLLPQDSDLGHDAQTVYEAIARIVTEWREYKAVAFEIVVSSVNIIKMVDAAIEKAALDGYATELQALKNKITGAVSLSEKVTVINKNIDQIVEEKDNVSDDQKENLIDIVESLTAALLLPDSNVSDEDKKSVIAKLKALIEADIFDVSVDKNSLALALKKLEDSLQGLAAAVVRGSVAVQNNVNGYTQSAYSASGVIGRQISDGRVVYGGAPRGVFASQRGRRQY
jgi:hypothetical protein